jgi:hypothetical protein
MLFILLDGLAYNLEGLGAWAKHKKALMVPGVKLFFKTEPLLFIK